MKRTIISALITLVAAFVLFYIFLPPLNLSSYAFWSYLFILTVIFSILTFFGDVEELFRYGKTTSSKKLLYVMWSIVGVLGLITVINFFASPIFNAKSYSKRIEVSENHEFVSDVSPVDFTKTPLIDKDSSQKLGDRKMGEFTSWVSQFYVSDIYSQINYNNEIVRVTPLEYADFIKYLTNRSEGIKGYIKVNSVDGSASLEELSDGMRYMPSAYFFENLDRKLRFSYPTAIFDEASFEVDNEGNPYWIVPTIKYTGVGLKKEINGAVILNPITGESKRYAVEDIPTWVDHVYSADLIIEQVDNWGEYRNGFFNSIFGQKDVINTTEGYNYLVMDDDVYLYTGITSVSSDESNLGFVLVNLRTKEANYYLAPGAEEFSAMASAEGLVQEKGYEASFPLLINLNNKPTYLLSLKDNAGLVKMYAFIDVADYQKVVVNDASLGIEAAAKKYLGEDISTGDLIKDEKIVIASIKDVVIDGNTYYYITDEKNNLYVAKINVEKILLPYLKAGDTITISYNKGERSNSITELEKN